MEAIINETESGMLKGIDLVELVFSNNPDAEGIKTAELKGLKTACINSKGKKRELFDNEVIELLQAYEFDYIILAGYMRILSSNFIKTFPNKIINIHPADTKLHQGINAYETAFENNWEETKITIHFVNEGVDTGEIIAQKTVDLRGIKTLEELKARGLAVEHQFYSETLRNLFNS